MFAQDIGPLSDGTANHTYVLLAGPSSVTNPTSFRKDSSAPSDQPVTLSIKHQTIGTGDKEQLSSVIRFDAVVERTEDQVQGTDSLYLVSKRSVKIGDTSNQLKLIALLVAFLAASGTKDKFLGGEV